MTLRRKNIGIHNPKLMITVFSENRFFLFNLKKEFFLAFLDACIF